MKKAIIISSFVLLLAACGYIFYRTYKKAQLAKLKVGGEGEPEPVQKDVNKPVSTDLIGREIVQPAIIADPVVKPVVTDPIVKPVVKPVVTVPVVQAVIKPFVTAPFINDLLITRRAV